MPARVVITGANGYVGCVLYDLLNSAYDLVLVDNKTGDDPHNRFGLETISPPACSAKSIIPIDLVEERIKFAYLLDECKPDLVIHLAGILENQTPDTITRKNLAINTNVVELCAEKGIKLIAMSSVMVMYGAAMHNAKIKSILERKAIAPLSEEEKIKLNDPLMNTEEAITEFNPGKSEQNFAYIKTKERLEELAQTTVRSKPGLTIAIIRLGWAGIRNPYALEGEDTKFTETSVYLDQIDLRSFMLKLLEAILCGHIEGYHCYCPISKHPQSWISLKACQEELDWEPSVDIIEKYARPADLALTFGGSSQSLLTTSTVNPCEP
ncbi:MAG: NAD(P)-dependent oxidoreductase [Gammaproteobacteria bacterium]|nr:NAD(P)-dependent oxidoreductase [Gammaproteobacteria bacterium]